MQTKRGCLRAASFLLIDNPSTMKTLGQLFVFIMLMMSCVQGLSQNATTENSILQQITVMEKGLLFMTNDQNATPQHIKPSGVESFIHNERAFSNAVITHQLGWHNMIFLQQSTAGGNLTIRQVGEANQYEGKITGNDIDIVITQQGELNVIDQSITSDQSGYTFRQEGNRNTIHHWADRSSIPLQIHQAGNDMKLIIKNGF